MELSNKIVEVKTYKVSATLTKECIDDLSKLESVEDIVRQMELDLDGHIKRAKMHIRQYKLDKLINDQVEPI